MRLIVAREDITPMAERRTYSTPKRAPEVIEFDLDGDTYHFTPPKRAVIAMPMFDTPTGSGAEAMVGQIKALFDWLGAGLPPDESDALEARLRDPADDLDIDTLSEIARDLIGASAARPTT